MSVPFYLTAPVTQMGFVLFFSLPAHPLPSAGFGMAVGWAHMGLLCHSFRTNSSPYGIRKLLKSSLLGLISPLPLKFQPLPFSESSQFIKLFIFKCPDLLNHSLDFRLLILFLFVFK